MSMSRTVYWLVVSAMILAIILWITSDVVCNQPDYKHYQMVITMTIDDVSLFDAVKIERQLQSFYYKGDSLKLSIKLNSMNKSTSTYNSTEGLYDEQGSL